jgi:hypothetical protein
MDGGNNIQKVYENYYKDKELMENGNQESINNILSIEGGRIGKLNDEHMIELIQHIPWFVYNRIELSVWIIYAFKAICKQWKPETNKLIIEKVEWLLWRMKYLKF